MSKATSGKQNTMEGLSTKSDGYPWVTNTSPTKGPQVSNTPERHSVLNCTPPQSSDSDSDSSSSYAGTSFADTSVPTSIPSTRQEEELRTSQESDGSNGVHPPTSAKHSARRILNERLEIEIHRTDRDVEQLQMLEQIFVDTAYDNTARQRLVQIRERLERARQKLQLLNSLRESADRLDILDFKFLLRNLL
ncbi:hypothetical protein BJX66DRAFT_344689 [Aspergillus keveii]|uniref:Uncharacterized protein n=1 Tax=Aspergillus keveii TaxID=714993 RepID=A0ABR4FKG3_9EURO